MIIELVVPCVPDRADEQTLQSQCVAQTPAKQAQGVGTNICAYFLHVFLEFQTHCEGGAKNFRLGQFFFNVPKTQFFHVFMVFTRH